MDNEIAPIGRAAAANPGTTIILAHFGHEAFLQAVTLLDEQPNVVADLTPVTGSPVPLTVEIAERARRPHHLRERCAKHQDDRR